MGAHLRRKVVRICRLNGSDGLLHGSATVRTIKLGFRTEVQQEANLEVRRAQVVINLSQRSSVKFGRRLDLYNELVVDHHVQALLGELFALVHDTNPDLAPYRMAAASEFSFQRQNVDVLEEPVAQCVVHFVERADDRVTDRLMKKTMSSWTMIAHWPLECATKTLRVPSNCFRVGSA